jgi:hypothetical protein
MTDIIEENWNDFRIKCLSNHNEKQTFAAKSLFYSGVISTLVTLTNNGIIDGKKVDDVKDIASKASVVLAAQHKTLNEFGGNEDG